MAAAADCEWSLGDITASGTVPACYCDFPTMVPPNGTACSWLFADNIRPDYDAASALMRAGGVVHLCGYVLLLWRRNLKRSARDVHKHGFWSAHWMRHSVDARLLLLGIANSVAFIVHAENLLAFGRRGDPRLERLLYLALDGTVVASGLSMVAVVLHYWSRLMRRLGIQSAARVERLLGTRFLWVTLGGLWAGTFLFSALEVAAVPDGNPSGAVYNKRWRAARFTLYTVSLAVSFASLVTLRNAIRDSLSAFAQLRATLRRLSRIIRLLWVVMALAVAGLGLLALSLLMGDTYALIEPLGAGAFRRVLWWLPVQLAPHLPIIVMSARGPSKGEQLAAASGSPAPAPAVVPGPAEQPWAQPAPGGTQVAPADAAAAAAEASMELVPLSGGSRTTAPRSSLPPSSVAVIRPAEPL